MITRNNSTPFKVVSEWPPAGDQPKAIEQMVKGFESGMNRQTLLGVTGSGKTFTVANVIEKLQKTTLVIAHNKTLAAQLANEFKQFFPENKVHYFVSYYDYYQPEAYVSATDTYIEKDASINEEIDRLRHASTQSILTRCDTVIVASVSCIYGLGSPEDYKKENLILTVGESHTKQSLMEALVNVHFERTNADLKSGTFRSVGNRVDVQPMSETWMASIFFSAGTISMIQILDPVSMRILEETDSVMFFPAKHFITDERKMSKALANIQKELEEQVKKFEKEGKLLEADRIKRRTMQDIAMMREVGYCSGIENYSRHLSGKAPGEPPETLLSYFPHDHKGNPEFLTVIDESHVTLPQLHGMYAGDQSRKQNLVNFGFRLPSALDNRPLRYEEFEQRVGQVLYVSATPGKMEVAESDQIVEMIVRPTGLLDPELTVKPVLPYSDQEKMTSKLRNLIYIPGMSGVDVDARKLMEEYSERNNFKLNIFSAWENSEDLQTKKLEDIKKEFNKFIKETKKENDGEIYLIAKSFGGGFALLNDLFNTKRAVLWAPAVGISTEGNFDDIKKIKLSEIKSLDDIKVSESNLSSVKTRSLIIWGNKDKVIKKEKLNEINSVIKGELFEFDNFDHSPENKEQANKLLTKTFEFLNDEYIQVTPENYPGQIEDFIEETVKTVKNGGRVIATTLTKKMAEDLANFLKERKIKAEYLHSDIKTIERIQILTKFRQGVFDCLVGVNLLREGLDLPEVQLIGILDADKEGFLRSETSLIQTIGRAARNVLGRVILYADVMTGSLNRAITETNRRRELQQAYNKEHGITPKTILKNIHDITEGIETLQRETAKNEAVLDMKLSGKKVSTLLKQKEKEMKQAAKELDFEVAAILRDEIKELERMLEAEKDKSDK